VGSSRFTDINESFVCLHCGAVVPPSNKSCRNHCPHCFYSVHLDVYPGDRSADCGGLMQPIEIVYHSKKGYQVVHQCLRCRAVSKNVLNFDDPLQPDSLEAAMDIFRRQG